MNIPSFDTKLKRHELAIKKILDLYREKCNDVEVKILMGKYKGRKARIRGVISDGGLYFLCMVQRADGKGALNSDVASRSYLPREYFEFV